jgi:hypothetical protein
MKSSAVIGLWPVSKFKKGNPAPDLYVLLFMSIKMHREGPVETISISSNMHEAQT